MAPSAAMGKPSVAAATRGPSAARRRGHSGALAGLAAVMVFLSVVSVWSAQRTNSAADSAARATRLFDVYQRARFAVGQEESFERKYRLEPGRSVRASYDAAAGDLVSALRKVALTGGGHDRALVTRLLAVHRRYLGATDRMFAAVDAGDTERVLEIDGHDTEPLFDTIEEQVDAAARSHRSAALQSLGALHATERFAMIATAIVSTFGLVLLAFFTILLSQMYGRLRQQAEENKYDALHDALTGLPNRVLFSDRLEQQIRASKREPSPFSILVFDLDRFKEINDTLGHGAGDRLLHEIGPRLLRGLRPADTVARLGGDEFAVLLPSAGSEEASEIAGRSLTALHEPFRLGDLTVTVDASIGIVTFPTHGRDAETLVQRADVAMYLAKDSGRGQAVYDPAADPYNPQRLALVGDLRSAIASDALDLHYQPKFDAADLRLAGVEALVRWNHPSRGMLAPNEFIALAEHTGLIKPLTLLVLRKAARQCRQWNEDGIDVSVAVNLSVANLLDVELVDDTARILKEERLPAERLEFEITESMVMSDPERAIAQLDRLAATGVRLAIDDFGTGHSSLTYLRRLPVSDLKIDRSFVRDLATDEDDAAIVRSTIELAHNLGLRVVAEGVEDAETLATLQQLGCDQVQGFHLCRPTAPELLSAQLEQFTARVPTLTSWQRPRSATRSRPPSGVGA